MAAAEVEEMKIFFDRINRIYRIKIEEALDVGDFDWWAALAEIRLDPPLLRLACRDDPVAPPKAPSLYRPDKPLLPAMVPKPHWIIARLRHPVDIPSPQRRPPEARQPSAVNPHFIRRT